MKRLNLLLLTLLAIHATACAQFETNAPEDMVWSGVSKDETASMPFGNGEVAGNVWVEKDGMLVYLARNDSFSELGRLLKIGRLRLSVDPCVWDLNCTQKLDFQSGRIIIENSYLKLTVFADSEYPVVWIHGKLESPAQVTLKPEIWRTAPHFLNTTEDEIQSAWSSKGFPELPFPESADVRVPGGFYHHNDTSAVKLNAINNHLDPAIVPDPILGRTFGALMSSNQLLTMEDGSLQSDGPVDEFTVKVAVISTMGDWMKESMTALDGVGTYRKAENRTKAYWNDFWDRSYISVSTPDTVSGNKITEAYACQRWMTACAGKSDYPIKFSGSIFTLQGPLNTINPDFRRWGECYWWQNTRLPYYSLVKSGDWDMLKSLFGFYSRLMPVFKAQAAAYHNADGATFPETHTQYGTFGVYDFGYGSTEAQNKCIRRIMQGPLDLLCLMLDYVRYSGDARFLAEEVAPAAEEFLEFFISRNKLDSTGKMRILNTQSLETFWYGIENDSPTVFGLHAVIRDFRSLQKNMQIPFSLEEKLSYLEKTVPDMPVMQGKNGLNVYAPAELFDTTRTNCENPELMAVFPFRHSTFMSQPELGINTFNTRVNRFNYGWPQDGQVAAILGLTDVAAEQLLARVDNTHPDYRFPAYYGPNFDWLPDQCHGGNIMIILQEMVMQCYGDKVYLLPAFPKDWNVRFRLATPGNNFVSGEYRDGKWYTKPKGDKKTDFVVQ